MTWVKTSDDEYDEPAIRKLSDAAFRLEKYGRYYASRQGTDGYLMPDQPERLLKLRRPRQTINELLEGGFWHASARPCTECLELRTKKGVTDPLPKDGYLIHRYHDRQPPQWEVLRDRAADRARKTRERSPREPDEAHPDQDRGVHEGFRGGHEAGRGHGIRGGVPREVRPAPYPVPRTRSDSSTYPVVEHRAHGADAREPRTQGRGLRPIADAIAAAQRRQDRP